MKYFKKYVPDTKLLLSNGKYYPFERIDASVGLAVVDNKTILGEFAAAIKGERGGVVEITKAEYDEIKKKALEQPLQPKLRDEISPRTLRESSLRQATAVAEPKPTPKPEPAPEPDHHHRATKHVARPKGIKR